MVQLATAKVGAIMVCINRRTEPMSLSMHSTRLSGTLITAESFKTSDYLGMLQTLAPELASCEPVHFNPNTASSQRVIRMGGDVTPGMLNFNDVCEMGTDMHHARLAELAGELRPDDAINIQLPVAPRAIQGGNPVPLQHPQ